MWFIATLTMAVPFDFRKKENFLLNDLGLFTLLFFLRVKSHCFAYAALQFTVTTR